METAISRTWPFAAPRSTASSSFDLLMALLAADAFDELSDAEDFAAVENYIKAEGYVRGDSAGRTRRGVVFWLYPTGSYGPYHVLEDGTPECHGVLVTVEPGVDVQGFMSELKNRFTTHGVYSPPSGITHEHFAASK
ncbi:hypothetical protein BS17DRAFT_783869 [Gyrodon lividus]|nr:hypothetical protein BS17DRAFT_783869 [Gyrodon lividus]